MQWTEPWPFLHRLPKHTGTGPALPACLPADSDLQEPSLLSSLPLPAKPASPPVRLRYLSHWEG